MHAHDVAVRESDVQKAVDTLRAEFALAGWTLDHQWPAPGTPGPGVHIFYASRWGHVRRLTGIDEARAFLQTVRGTRV